MNVLFNACSVAILTRTNSRAVKSSIGAFSALSWKTGVGHNATRKVDSDLLLKRICFRCYSSKKSSGDSSSSEKSDPTPKMKEDRDGFFVVRKGDLVGVYKNLSDCQTQVGSSICDPPVSVYKGYAMPKDTEEYLLSCGLKNALYSIRAADLTEDLFGTLIPCPFQQPSSSKGGMPEHMPKKRSQEVMWSEYSDAVGPAVISNDFLRKHVKLDDHKGDQALSSGRSCTLEFDGASKGNPGLAGAGAVLRADDGCFICRLREGLGVATNNAAEYRGIILGLKYALSKGFTSIRVQGDSKLVCMQIQGLWKVKNQNISTLYEQAKQLKDRFLSFRIIHVLRESNSDADVQANLGVELAEGQIQEEIEK
ncbi:uncharacterized protein [Nicotiana tomentosiformis]|uniref:uncharacterized protein isoform X1 n=2 Tax=Nicotiana tomentosiformis TaxID=4098 RepID=UPI00051B3913|nr:uncharacterized protein LOC104089283 isoform X1 [Nicotiana tomentosiformis]XP_033510189.1 uncharacterized protein LOC104089283 isoform X1 [Nicotiana tomentosiformis]XP_033510190.1 uncharacterized protein LOC104089283 isoform X1 [Nicotiana tomentosiformis]